MTNVKVMTSAVRVLSDKYLFNVKNYRKLIFSTSLHAFRFFTKLNRLVAIGRKTTKKVYSLMLNLFFLLYI
jgi:hypothetical protein